MGIYVCPLVVASVLIRSLHLLACKVSLLLRSPYTLLYCHCFATCPTQFLLVSDIYGTCTWTSWLSLEDPSLWKDPLLWHSHPSTVNRHKSSWRVSCCSCWKAKKSDFNLGACIASVVFHVIVSHECYLQLSITVNIKLMLSFLGFLYCLIYC